MGDYACYCGLTVLLEFEVIWNSQCRHIESGLIAQNNHCDILTRMFLDNNRAPKQEAPDKKDLLPRDTAGEGPLAQIIAHKVERVRKEHGPVIVTQEEATGSVSDEHAKKRKRKEEKRAAKEKRREEKRAAKQVRPTIHDSYSCGFHV